MRWLSAFTIVALLCNIVGAYKLWTNVDTEWGFLWLLIGFVILLLTEGMRLLLNR